VCGIAHNLFGMENVGFHLGPEDVTMDLDGELTRAQLQEIERRANEVVFANVPVWVTYPAPEELPGLTYRSKLELTEDVRLVHIGDVDVCACCVPHVMRTGEVGLIKILEAMRFRGGMRIHLKCGRDALADYNVKYRNIQQISALFSAKQHETAEAAEQFYQQYQHEKYIVAQLKKELAHAKAQNLPETAGNLCIFEDGEPDTLREIVNIGMTKCGKVCGVFSGSDAEGYKYILGSRTVNLRNEAKNFNRALNGRGGGRPEMIQGSVQAARAEIEAWFAAF
jgi:alanyl-tRNA synthetase